MSILDKKSAWARKRRDHPLVAPDLYELVDLHFATQFIAERMETCGTGIRTLKERVRHQITDGKKGGALPHQNDLFVFGELIAWAKNKKKLANAVKGLMHIGHANSTCEPPPVRLSASGISLPLNLAACHDELKDAQIELRKLRYEKMALELTVAELTRDKEKADLIRHKKKVGGQRGGRSRRL